MYGFREKLGRARNYVRIVSIFLAFGLLISTLASCAGNRALNVTLPEGDVKVADAMVDVDSVAVGHEELLEGMFSEDASKDALMVWLAGKKIFSFDDPRLAEVLENDLCAPVTGESPKARVAAAEECASKDLAAALRKLSEQRKVPFHYVGTVVQVGVPSTEDQPVAGRANVCRNSKFRTKKLELFNPQTSGRIEVVASGLYTCTGYSDYPDIQLNYADAKQLFRNPLDKYQQVVAVPIRED